MVCSIESATNILSNPRLYPSHVVLKALKFISDRSMAVT